ncbi:MAG: HAMP domain-containing sensor histidine kinase [Patescibacteria group bacterium]
MPLLPFDLVLTVGASAAVFVLGLMVWARNKWAMGNLLYGLMAISLALWTSAGWFLHLEMTALPFQVFLWNLVFYLCVACAPAFAAHAGSVIARRPRLSQVTALYVFGFLVFILIALGLTLNLLLPSLVDTTSLFSVIGVGGLVLYALAIVVIALELYPTMYARKADVLERRRAAYGVMILVPFLLAGALQFIVGPIPTGFLMPFLAFWFLVFSLLAFIRASLLDVEFRPLEAFLLFLCAFAAVILLRSRDLPEAIVALVGSVAVGIFGFVAVRVVRSERQKRLVLEETNRQLKLVEEAKSDFIDMVAHQLRGPLGGIRASASMLKAGDYGELPPKAKTAATLIGDSATRLLSLSDSFLNASRLEVGTYESVPVPTDVHHELRSISDEMASEASAKHLRLATHVAPDVPKNISIDVEALRHVVFNLLDNAIKYTDAGTVELRCSIDAQKLLIDVTDSGVGMAHEELGQLFRKFHRGKDGRARSKDGTGLGLFIVKQLVEAAGGSISAESPGQGQGSRFRVWLPFSAV